MAYDAANEYLAERRLARAPRRPGDPPPLNGKLLHHMDGFRHFGSIEEAVFEVTEAVLARDGACLPGRELNPELVEVSLIQIILTMIVIGSTIGVSSKYNGSLPRKH